MSWSRDILSSLHRADDSPSKFQMFQKAVLSFVSRILRPKAACVYSVIMHLPVGTGTDRRLAPLIQNPRKMRFKKADDGWRRSTKNLNLLNMLTVANSNNESKYFAIELLSESTRPLQIVSESRG